MEHPDRGDVSCVDIVPTHNCDVGSRLGIPGGATRGERYHVRLSPREQQTLALLLEGLPAKLIAARLRIGVRTANQYTTSLFRQFGVHSRAGLLARFVCVNPEHRGEKDSVDLAK
jgi:DNA-binding CsgD family transcriptional regulator